MAKLTKLKSALKKMNSFGKNNSNSNNKKKALNRADSGASSSSSGSGCSESDHNKRLQRVYVGRSRKEYHVPADLLGHPIVRELVVVTTHQSDTETTTSMSSSITIGCEAVLFDHLLWMLEDVNNPAAAGSGPQIQPLDLDIDLARFYAY